MKKKVAIVGTVGIPACYGGFESLVENLTLNGTENIQYTVYCSPFSYKERLLKHNNAYLKYVPLKANGIQSIPYDIASMVSCLVNRPDTVIILGVSGCIFLPIYRLFSNSRIITNIDGLEWKRDKWGKWTQRFLKWSESLAVKYSDAVVTDNQAIADYVSAEYSVSSQTIAYGGDHALRNVDDFETRGQYALGLCRIEPENNVAMILEAFSKVGKNIKFVGNWNASEFGHNLKNKYGSFKNIELLDPIYDLDELFLLRKGCEIYLHGHSAGGTNPSLVEMMHFGVPIIAFDCDFNRYSTDNKAHYFKSSELLASFLDSDLKEELKSNGANMKMIASERYTWHQITKAYENMY